MSKRSVLLFLDETMLETGFNVGRFGFDEPSLIDGWKRVPPLAGDLLLGVLIRRLGVVVVVVVVVGLVVVVALVVVVVALVVVVGALVVVGLLVVGLKVVRSTGVVWS